MSSDVRLIMRLLNDSIDEAAAIRFVRRLVHEQQLVKGLAA